MPARGDEGELGGHEQRVEGQQRERGLARRQANLAERPGEAKSVQEAEQERDQPRRAPGQRVGVMPIEPERELSREQQD